MCFVSHRRIPNPNVFHRLINRVRTSGFVIPVRKNVGAGRDFIARTYENEEEVLRIAEENPSISIRAISREIGISKSTIRTILKENEMHAFHYSKVQQLLPQDYARRITFCTWLLNQEERQPGFVHHIMFSDESYFIREGIFNRRNYHIWANENPHEYLPINSQHRFSINLWAGIVDNTLVSIIFYCLYYYVQVDAVRYS